MKKRLAIRDTLVAFSLTCPICGYELEAPNGSLIWLAEDLPLDDELVCCETILIIPTRQNRPLKKRPA